MSDKQVEKVAKTQPGASSSWKFRTMGQGLTFDRGEQVNPFYQWDMQTSHTFHTEGPVWYE